VSNQDRKQPTSSNQQHAASPPLCSVGAGNTAQPQLSRVDWESVASDVAEPADSQAVYTD